MKLIVSSKLVIFFEIQTIPQSLILRTRAEEATLHARFRDHTHRLPTGFFFANQRESERIFAESIPKFLKTCYAFYRRKEKSYLEQPWSKFPSDRVLVPNFPKSFHLRCFDRKFLNFTFLIFYMHEIIFSPLIARLPSFPVFRSPSVIS